MILLEQTFCWIDLRIIGIIYSFINMILDAAVALLAMLVAGLLNSKDHIAAVCFAVLYIILHIMLIYGLGWRKPTILMWWLAFAPFHIITLQAVILVTSAMFLINLVEKSWVAILMLLGHLIVTTFMFHNVCVVFSVRHRLIINNQNEQNRNCNNSYVNNIGDAMIPLTTPEPYESNNQGLMKTPPHILQAVHKNS